MCSHPKVLLNYKNLIDKAQREIGRLKQAENECDIIAALDHALNAAFTVYHLLEWRQNPSGTSKEELKKAGIQTCGAQAVCTKIDKSEFDVLHGIVTHTKHATVSSWPRSNEHNPVQYKPKCDDHTVFMVTENGQPMITESEQLIITENSEIIIYFGESIALKILEKAMEEFTPVPNVYSNHEQDDTLIELIDQGSIVHMS